MGNISSPLKVCMFIFQAGLLLGDATIRKIKQEVIGLLDFKSVGGRQQESGDNKVFFWE